MGTSMRQDERGAYRWTGYVDHAYEKKSFHIAFGVTGGICVFFIVMSLLLGGDMFGVTLLSCLGAMAVVGGVCWLFDRYAGHWGQSYLMTEDRIVLCRRRSNIPFPFKSIRKAVVYPARHMVELYQLAGSLPVFAPPEDFDFVRDFILDRLPESAEVVYE